MVTGCSRRGSSRWLLASDKFFFEQRQVRHRALEPLSSTMFLRGELCMPMRCDVFSAERPTLAHAWWDKLTHVHCAALLVGQVSQQGEFLALQGMLPYSGRVSLSAASAS
jgi:hypothetical protein